MKKLNSKGFSALEIILVLVIVGILGLVGWYVWTQQTNSSDSSQSDNTQTITNFDECVAAGNPVMESYPEQCAANGQTFTNESQQNTQNSDVKADDWLLYESPGESYSVRIPDGWELHRFQHNDGLYSTDIEYKPGTKAVVIEDEGGRDFANLPFGLNLFAEDDEASPSGEEQKTFTTSQNYKVVLYTYEQTEEPDGIGPPKDTKTYAYWITSGTTTVNIHHDVLKSETEQTELIEKMIDTLEIK